MADMTHKHHNLIFDAITEGAVELTKTKEFQSISDWHQQRQLLWKMVNCIAMQFANRLRYTNDKFEAHTWQCQVTGEVDRIWKEYRKTVDNA